MPAGRGSNSLKDPELYEELRADGASKEKAARISNAAARDGRKAVGKRGGAAACAQGEWPDAAEGFTAKKRPRQGPVRVGASRLPQRATACPPAPAGQVQSAAAAALREAQCSSSVPSGPIGTYTVVRPFSRSSMRPRWPRPRTRMVHPPRRSRVSSRVGFHGRPMRVSLSATADTRRRAAAGCWRRPHCVRASRAAGGLGRAHWGRTLDQLAGECCGRVLRQPSTAGCAGLQVEAGRPHPKWPPRLQGG